MLIIQNDDERFEAVYFEINNIPYINYDTAGDPLYSSLSALPQETKHSVKEVFETAKKLIKEGYVCCLGVIKNEEKKSLYQRINAPNLTSFNVFSKYWLSITSKGKSVIETEIK